MTKNIHKKNLYFRNFVANNDKRKIMGVALDTAKSFHLVLIFNFVGKVLVPPFPINTLKSGYEELKKQIRKAELKIKPVRTYIALETPAKYLSNLVDHLRNDYKHVVYINTNSVADNRKQRTFRGLKTDEIDAGAIGDLLIRGEFNKIHDESLIYYKLKNLVLWREHKVIMQTMIKHQLTYRFERIYPGINCHFGESKALYTEAFKSKLHRGLLNSNKLVNEVLDCDEYDLLDEFEYDRLRGGIFHIRRLRNRLNEILLPNTRKSRIELDMLKKDLAFLSFYEKEIQLAEDEIVALGEQTNAKHLFNQIKGLSNLLACVYVGLIGDIKKYRSANHIYSYAGLNPRHKQSGNTSIKRGIKRSGNLFLRVTLFRIAKYVMLSDEYFYKYFKKLREEKNKSYKESIIIISRRLNNIFYALMRDKSEYNHK